MRIRAIIYIALMIALMGASSAAQRTEPSHVKRLDPRLDNIIAKNIAVERIADGSSDPFVISPEWCRDTCCVYDDEATEH